MRYLFILGAILSLISVPIRAQSEKIAFIPGDGSPFYVTMQRGIEQAAADLGVEVVTQVPRKLDPAAQIQLVNSLVADKAIKALVIAPADAEQLVPALRAADKSGIAVITVATYLGNGDYLKGPVTFPVSHIGSDDEAGGRFACNTLAQSMGKRGEVYIQNGSSADSLRESGCKAALAAYPDIMLSDHETDGHVQVAAFDASPDTIQHIRDGSVTLAIAQKPYDMGYTAVGYAAAYLNGVTSLPKRVQTGFALIDRKNIDDPATTQFEYSASVGKPVDALSNFKIAFVPGTVDPFYVNMQRGIEDVARMLNVDVVTQVPQKFDPSVQIPIIQALTANKGANVLIVAATDKDQLIPVLQAVNNEGIPVISVDTFIGDGDYEHGVVTFPLSYIGSDNEEGGRIACVALAESINRTGKVYIQNVKPTISTNIQRESGCKEALAAYSDIQIVAVDYNDNDAAKAQLQTEQMLEREKDLAGIFGTNVFSAEGAGTAVVNAGLKGAVQVVAFDATRDAIEKLYDGIVTRVIAQKPYDMGFLAAFYAMAHARGVTSIPKRIPTGFAVIDINNVGDPEVSRFIYR